MPLLELELELAVNQQPSWTCSSSRDTTVLIRGAAWPGPTAYGGAATTATATATATETATAAAAVAPQQPQLAYRNGTETGSWTLDEADDCLPLNVNVNGNVNMSLQYRFKMKSWPELNGGGGGGCCRCRCQPLDPPPPTRQADKPTSHRATELA
ncbi:hypothetical protein AWZ03_001694 [Drosophila navojoa]|uniref:Uncharacterized protein n=1 Tax=Drosophila navojoa TaxID=7232 RepID=A0A484BTN7_DRONA|nr:hypothetical protein AWZ03_001694 [Drosophila navojoa]